MSEFPHRPAGVPRVALGCMRLSTEREPPESHDERGVAVLHAAFDAGITLLDTADAYCFDTSDVGHNERLIARAISTWEGDQSRIQVATKGGLTRPQGGWVPDGRARHLTAACEASRRALGVERIHLYQLHAPDPRVPLSTSVRALDALKRNGHVESIGLCNVNVGQIEEARRITEIAAVQVELSVWKDDNILNGIVAYCLAHRIPLLAYRPLGGAQRARRLAADPVLAEVAARHGVSACEVALAWLTDLSDLIVPVAGATRIETVQSIARAATVVFDDDDRARLDERFPTGRAVRHREGSPSATAVPARDGDVVLIMGLPGAGKSTVAESFVARGYARVNRDTAGGSLSDLLPELDRSDRLRRVAHRSRQHLCIASVARASGRHRFSQGHAGPMPVDRDKHRGCPGQRRPADDREARTPARPRRDSRRIEARRHAVRPWRAVPLSA